MRIDLHLHTTASDGQLTPNELIQLARKIQLGTIAITDHDTTDGIVEAIREASHTGTPFVIPGIELSAEDASGDVHMLGYFIDTGNANLQTRLAKFRQDRATRAQQIVQKLVTMGMPIQWERVLEIAAGSGKKSGVIGRPHVARAMIEAGYVDSIPDAFQRYLNPDKPAYVGRERLSPEGAIALIHSAGGVAVLAHPAKLANYGTMTRRLVPMGLDGVEVVHPANSESVRLDLRGLARECDLVMTGGSDFHGVDDRGGMSIGSFTPPDGCVPILRARAERYKQN
jgi:predicted metal-dependent phosphoesterase TrpH